MATFPPFSTNLKLTLIATGAQAGTWGDTTNTNLGYLLEEAISGYITQAVSTGTSTVLTMDQGVSCTARNMFIELTGTGGTSTYLEVPDNSKLYFIYNNTTGAVTVRGAGGSGVSVPAGARYLLVYNGTDIINAISSNLTYSGNTNYLPKFATSTSLGNSNVYDNGTNVGIGTNSPTAKLDVLGSFKVTPSIYGSAYTGTFFGLDAPFIVSADYDNSWGLIVTNPNLPDPTNQGAAFTVNTDFNFYLTVFGSSGAFGALVIDPTNKLVYIGLGESTTKVGIGSVGAPTAALDVNSDTVRLRTAKTPASATATGNAGDICWDSGYVYVCVAANTWKRAALATW